ncbi:histidine kinase [uncultured Lutibacter sp.]|uniref:sensor histidine kinase n=1 Tax=uncultured Lutibacter sp. TaxID=437739 RepID=UPI00262CB3D6|nr:histidine kinase [uncultured Lutibacter sp.]
MLLNKKHLLNTVVSHAIFWVLLFLFFVLPTLGYQSMKLAYVAAYATKIIPQMMVAYVMIYVLVPYVLNRYGKILFGINVFVLLYLAFVLYTFFRYYGFEIVFPEFYRLSRKVDFWWRATDFHYFAQNIIWFLFPAVILMSVRYYKHQREALELREQKKVAELSALKNQLNPHFLFNTLNNLYALAIKKSDQTPEVIAKLSEILDYTLYRCNKEFVALSDEVKLLNNYIALEKIRYGKRVYISFESNVDNTVKIAPLLLLTFFENAFKHGVSQEIREANIIALLKTEGSKIYFSIENTISTHKHDEESREAIGLSNVQKQLELLYPNNHKLVVRNEDQKYKVDLKIKTA